MRVSRVGYLLAIVVGVVVCLSSSVGSAASLTVTSQQLTPYRTCLLTATPVGTTVVSDTTVRQGTPAGNFGTVTNLTVSSAASANQRTYLSFDLASCAPAIPASATVRGAVLRLFSTALPAVCRTVDIFRVTAAWTETVVTWNSQPFGTAINNPADRLPDRFVQRRHARRLREPHEQHVHHRGRCHRRCRRVRRRHRHQSWDGCSATTSREAPPFEPGPRPARSSGPWRARRS